jgi:hypothetical protein
VFEEPIFPWTPLYTSVEALVAKNPTISVVYDANNVIPAVEQNGVIVANIGG